MWRVLLKTLFACWSGPIFLLMKVMSSEVQQQTVCMAGPNMGGACGPYVQSMRVDKYKHHADLLVEVRAARGTCITMRHFHSEGMLTAVSVLLVAAATAHVHPKLRQRSNNLASLMPSECVCQHKGRL